MAKRPARKQKKSEESSILNEAQHRAAILLAAGRSGRAVADEIGVHECTVYDWKADPKFKAQINAILAEARQQTSRKLVNLARLSCDSLEKILTSPDSTDNDKLKAVALVFDMVAPPPTEPGELARWMLENGIDASEFARQLQEAR